MIREEYVIFETAKLLKEAGFPQNDRYYARYNSLGQDWHMGDNIDKFNIQPGQEVTVDVDLFSREFNGRYYTTVSAWRVTPSATIPTT